MVRALNYHREDIYKLRELGTVGRSRLPKQIDTSRKAPMVRDARRRVQHGRPVSLRLGIPAACLRVAELLGVLKAHPLGDLGFHVPWHSARRGKIFSAVHLKYSL